MHTVHGYPHITLSCLHFTLRHDENGSPSYYSHFPALCSCWTRCLAYGCARYTRSRTVGSHRQPEQAVFAYASDRRSVSLFKQSHYNHRRMIRPTHRTVSSFYQVAPLLQPITIMTLNSLPAARRAALPSTNQTTGCLSQPNLLPRRLSSSIKFARHTGSTG